jgi:hypothetical protein
MVQRSSRSARNLLSYAGRSVCSRHRTVAIDGSKFKAVNTRDKNFTQNKVERRRAQLVKLESEMQRLATMEKLMLASPDQQVSLTDPDSRSMATSGRGSGVVGYNVQVGRYQTSSYHCA